MRVRFLTTKDKPTFAVPDFGAAGKMTMGTLPLPGRKITLERRIGSENPRSHKGLTARNITA